MKFSFKIQSKINNRYIHSLPPNRYSASDALHSYYENESAQGALQFDTREEALETIGSFLEKHRDKYKVIPIRNNG